MADKKISDLVAGATPLTDDDLLETEQPAQAAGTRSRKLTLAQVLTWALSKTHTMTAAINEARADAIASGATVDIGAIVGNLVHITGTTTITSFGTIQAGTRRRVIFDAALILTHNATSLILPTAANITTVAGDSAEFVSEGAGNWRCTSYQRATGFALAAPSTKDAVSALTNSSGTVTVDCTLGKSFTITLAANVTTLALTNLNGAGFATEIEIEIKQNGTGGFTFTLPASFKALGGSDTAIAAGANAVTVISAKTFDNGTTWRYAMQESA